MSEDAPDDLAKFFSGPDEEPKPSARSPEAMFGGTKLGQIDIATALSSVREFQENRERGNKPIPRDVGPEEERYERARKHQATSARTNQALDQIRRRERFVVRLTWTLAISFICGIGVAVVLTDEQLSSRAVTIIAAIRKASGGSTVNCADPRNARSQECIERQDKLEAEWKSITRNEEGKSNPFAIHGKE